jgi:hypothetical protein
MTFEKFQDAMVAYAKRVQGECYIGDEYYRRDEPCWRDPFEQGDTPEETVSSDMSCWDVEAEATVA